MSKPFRISILPTLIAVALAGCGGGGGGGGGSVVASPTGEVPFSSFSAISPNQTVVMPGLAHTGSGTDTTFSANQNSTDGVVRLTFDADGNMSGISIATPASSVSFKGSEIVCITGAACGASNATSAATVVDPSAPGLGWNYQSFGVWMKDINPTSFQAGAISAGAPTPASAVPTTSTATFKGHAGGFYFEGANRYSTDSAMTAVTNFENRSIQFSTTGTVVVDLKAPHNPDGSLNTVAKPGLDLSGKLDYAPGVNRFSGTVTTQDTQLSGKADGRFYGPNAQEIGGTYGLNGAGGKSMVGGFGGKR